MTFTKHAFAYLFLCFAIGVLVEIFSLNISLFFGLPAFLVVYAVWNAKRQKIKFPLFYIYAALVFQLLGWVSVREFNERHFDSAQTMRNNGF
jgi:hypothetical protein